MRQKKNTFSYEKIYNLDNKTVTGKVIIKIKL